VTGVQTCALPIFSKQRPAAVFVPARGGRFGGFSDQCADGAFVRAMVVFPVTVT